MKTLTNRSKSTKPSTATALLANATIAGIGGAFKLYRRTLVSELVTAAAACTARIITNQVLVINLVVDNILRINRNSMGIWRKILFNNLLNFSLSIIFLCRGE